ncbi:hypothetical protein HPB48_003280 [Haemaphysalis longicornis]|uniref:Uncharacterized protein n=1 Tax=Haemaphysalis longicornis TaxID=44386 RepID=A0A9J6H1U7_HAELO|nr:hypothetical protein HPB48_003280 [Haemaphysalis longicornis]
MLFLLDVGPCAKAPKKCDIFEAHNSKNVHFGNLLSFPVQFRAGSAQVYRRGLGFTLIPTLMLFPKVIGGELQDRLIPVPYSKSATDQAIRVVNAFRSNLDARNNPAYQTALLRKASAASPSGTGGFVRPQLHAQPTRQPRGPWPRPRKRRRVPPPLLPPAVPPREPPAAAAAAAAAAREQPPAKEGDATSNHSVETAV